MAKPIIRECIIHGQYRTITGEDCPACALEEEGDIITVLCPGPIPVAVERRMLCTCTHTEREHCKGGVEHVAYKVKQGERARADQLSICSTRHCSQPLCTCVDFMPAPAGEGASL